MILLDTDHFSILLDERDARHNGLVGHLLGLDESQTPRATEVEFKKL